MFRLSTPLLPEFSTFFSNGVDEGICTDVVATRLTVASFFLALRQIDLLPF